MLDAPEPVPRDPDRSDQVVQGSQRSRKPKEAVVELGWSHQLSHPVADEIADQTDPVPPPLSYGEMKVEILDLGFAPVRDVIE